MKKGKSIGIVLVILTAVWAILPGCRQLNNPVDPEATNYQGYPTVDSIDEVQLISPTDDETIYYLDLSWSELLGAEQYHIQISNSESSFEGNVVYENEDCRDNSTHIDMLPWGEYFCRIRAKLDGSWSSWTDILKFTGECLTGLEPVSPGNDGDVGSDIVPLLDWNDAEVVEGVVAAASYQVQLTISSTNIDSADILDASLSQYQLETALSIGQLYEWRVRPVNSEGIPGFWSSTWNFDTHYELGDTGPAGGLIFYYKENYSDGWRFLEGAPVSTEWEDIEWGDNATEISGADGTVVGTGAQNTADIVALQGAGSTYAAQLCDGLSHGGFSDWFLPSRDELNLMYENLHREDLGDFNSGGFISDFYWSSSEYSSSQAWNRRFISSGEYVAYKNHNKRVRAIRDF